VLQRGRLYVDTLRHTRPGQLGHRIRLRLVRSWPLSGLWHGRPAAAADGGGEGRAPIPPFLPAPWDASSRADAVRRAAELVAGRFTFLDQTIVYPEKVRWDESRAARLWRFHLHYFDYAVDLGIAHAANPDGPYWAAYRALVEDWITANPATRGDGWHPFTVSLRLVNWIWAYHYFADRFALDDRLRRRIVASIHGQARYLAAALERDVTGNHLIKNAKALVLAGAFLGDRDGARWTSIGRRLLAEETHTQILADGGHYERSPLYHAEVLKDYLDVVPCLPAGSADRAVMGRAIAAMSAFLGEIAHPDGTLPLFNDGELQPSVPAATLLRRAEESAGEAGATARGGGPPRSTEAAPSPTAVTAAAFAESGYYVLRSGDHVLILDCGPVCPGHLPAHAHCDLLSFELSCGGVRLITNSGTYTYEPGAWRDAFRGTAAHNTVQAGEEEQSAIWGAFRVGRRAEVTAADLRLRPAGAYFRGAYRGFDGNRTVHVRELTLLPGPCWVVVDTVTRPAGARVPVSGRLHFAPRTTLTPEGAHLIAAREGAALAIVPFGADAVAVRDGWFSPALGRREEAPHLVLSGNCDGRRRMGFVLAPPSVPVEVERFDGGAAAWVVRLIVAGRPYEVAPQP
jgi:hypothetical protein